MRKYVHCDIFTQLHNEILCKSEKDDIYTTMWMNIKTEHWVEKR